MFLIVIVGVYFYFSSGLPQIKTLEEYQPPVVTTIYSDDDHKIGEFYKQRRIVIPLKEMPDQLIHAFVAAEDARFYEHEGIDVFSIARAFFRNLEAGRIVQGGSTITQQVAKSFFLTPKQTYTRKIKEAILAYRIDKHFSKEEILFLYLNQIYLGNGAYGVQAAAQNYFNKSAKELNLPECAMLAGLPQAPSFYSPKAHPERAKERQIYVLTRMAAEGFISQDEATEAIQRKITMASKPEWFMENTPYYTEHVRKWIKAKFGTDALYTDGLKIYTCVDIKMQKAAQKSIEKGLRALDKRRGYRGPLLRLEKSEIEPYLQSLKKERGARKLFDGVITHGVVIDVDETEQRIMVRLGGAVGALPFSHMRWARQQAPEFSKETKTVKALAERLAVGDVIQVKLKKWQPSQGQWELRLEQKPNVQSALLCMQPENGHVKAMVGGRDFAESQFNRAVQARRQPGSAFKPIIYAAALDNGYTVASIIPDSPLVFENKELDYTWKPENYDKTFHGFTLFREGLIHSRNIVTLKILQDIGIDYAIDYAHKLGIDSHLDRNLALGLGASGVSLLELTEVYSVFANQGRRVEPVFVRRIEDRSGHVIYQAENEAERVISPATAYIMTHLLQKVVEEGTGWRVRALQRPAAGKTGTTNDLNDAWFMGYTPRCVTGVWVGFDQGRPLGKNETGSRAASPIWLDFMQQILSGKPQRVFHAPDNVVFTKIDAETGLLPIPASDEVIWGCFKKGTIPKRHTRSPDQITHEEFFKKGF
ncbi:MAG: PBP1A family penicillin-binding protein [Desulfobacterales bacterium]|nr:PBP1A family penicillin-binding protein [Desulfobacterales bacterium]